MVRNGLVIAGFVLIVAGAVLAAFGYQETRPSAEEQTIRILEQVSGQPAPQEVLDELPSKTAGYVMMAGGAVGFLAGLGLILLSRTRGGRPQMPTDAQG